MNPRSRPSRCFRLGAAFALALAAVAIPAPAQHDHHAGAGAYTEGDELGAVSFPVSCDPATQAEFDRGVALLHHMMYVESRSVFVALTESDPGCAMAHWGIAMTLFQPLWPTRPTTGDLERGFAEIERAKSTGSRTVREEAFIAAAAAFFSEPKSADYWARIGRFETGMEAVYRAYPDDREAAAFYSLSLLATASQADQPLAQHARAAELLLEIYRQEPTHPGAIHYTIHANDVEGRQGQSLDVVRAYDDIAPSVPHALHMPTHIFVRLGSWDDVILWNEKSADAALDFPAGDRVSHHYPHALDYLIYAHLQQGNDAAAQDVLERARRSQDYQPTFISAFHLASIPARYAVERRDWKRAASLEERTPADLPWEKFPWPEAINRFARGLGAARSGDREAARAALDELDRLARKAREAGESYFAEQIEVSRLAVEAWIAFDEGRTDDAERSATAAAELEATMEKHPVTPGALQPAYELLGDLYLEMERPRDAFQAYEASLKSWPRRYHSLLGAARAAAGAGDSRSAAAYYADFLDLAGSSSERSEDLAEARGFGATVAALR